MPGIVLHPAASFTTGAANAACSLNNAKVERSKNIGHPVNAVGPFGTDRDGGTYSVDGPPENRVSRSVHRAVGYGTRKLGTARFTFANNWQNSAVSESQTTVQRDSVAASLTDGIGCIRP
jgi:hypothetical protein